MTGGCLDAALAELNEGGQLAQRLLGFRAAAELPAVLPGGMALAATNRLSFCYAHLAPCERD